MDTDLRADFEKALDDLHMAADIISQMLDFFESASSDAVRIRIEAEAFLQHIRTEWNR